MLAIDYEVVVKGVREKIQKAFQRRSAGISLIRLFSFLLKCRLRGTTLQTGQESCRSNSYTASGVNIVAEFISDVMGTNPRTFKRLVNAFFLINSVNEIGEDAESKTKEINDVLMFCSLCIQMCLPKLYELMVTASTKKQLKELLEVKAGGNQDLCNKIFH